MKKILLLAITIFSINSAFAQSQRLAFVEEFTQASCPPCETTTPMLNSILNTNSDKVVQLRYQTSWPGVDPMNADNPREVQERVDYYGVTGVPTLQLDGSVPSGPVFPQLITQSNIDASYGSEAPVAMTVEHTLADNLSSMTVTLTVTNEGTDAYSDANNRLRVALVEEEITWSSPPGSTSITVFDAVMKTFLTTTAGMEIPEIAAGESWTQTWEDIAITPGMYDFRELGVVAFIQNDSNRSIAQSAHSSPLEIGDFPDASVESTTETAGDLCDYAFFGTAEVTNSGSLDATGYSVDLILNGAVEQTKTFEEVLSAGTSTTVTFDEVTLPTGTSIFGYNLRLAEGDISTINNRTSAIGIGKAGGVAESIDRDFENDTPDAFTPAPGTIVDVPFETLNFTVVSQDIIGGNTPTGGYGESANAISVYLWAWNTASIDPNGYMVIADQYVVPDDGISLSFDYAYTSWGGSNDRMIVEVSTDCGVSFDEVFNQAGTDLQTAPELNEGGTFWRPSADHWRTVETDLKDYAGETILLRYRVVSDYGDMIYLDNIELKVITDINELGANESLNVYPNPASTSVNVELTTANASNVQLRVIDMLGRTLQTQNLGTVSGTVNHALDVSALANGSYLIFMNVDGKDVVKRISVSH